MFCLVCPCGAAARMQEGFERIPSSRQRVFLHSRLQSARETQVQGESGSAHSALIASNLPALESESLLFSYFHYN